MLILNEYKQRLFGIRIRMLRIGQKMSGEM